MTRFRCLVCRDFYAASAVALRLHLIRHGPAEIAKFVGYPYLVEFGTWGRLLRKAVGELVDRGRVL